MCLASFLFPFYADELTTMAVRIRDRENLLQAHRRNIYQLLANEKGIPHWKVSLGCGLLQSVVGMSVLAVRPFGLVAVMALLGFYCLAFFAFAHHVRKNVAPART